LYAHRPGLPDSTHIFEPKFQFWYILEGLGIETFGIVSGHLEYVHLAYVHYGQLVILVYFPQFWYIVCTKKNLATLTETHLASLESDSLLRSKRTLKS
jgi:hypothetical protein